MFTAANQPETSLRGERQRLGWVSDRFGAYSEGSLHFPQVVSYVENTAPAGQWSYLLTQAVPGVPLHEAINETPIRVGRLMGQSLRTLHAVDPSGCPAWLTPDDLLARAEQNLTQGHLSSEVRSRGSTRSPERLLKQLTRRPPATFDPVVCHGDYCLPNVLAALDDSCGLVDLGGLCVSDRHLDLAAAVRSLRYNGGLEDVVRVFLNWYGHDDVDEVRLRYYTELWELL